MHDMQSVARAIRAQSPVAQSRYVCRAHLLPVNWRGDGCLFCAAALHESRSSRRGRRSRRRYIEEKYQP